MNNIDKLVDSFCRVDAVGQAIFIIIILSMVFGFITVLVRGYPNG